MKIIIINGSPRKNGVTASILHIIEENLKKNRVDTRFVNLSEISMEHCTGCCSCYKTGHCYIDDDAERLSIEIEKADGIVIGSPTYASNISGYLKQFIDRGHFVIEQLLHNKYAITIATGENYGSKDTSNVLNKLINYSGGKISGKLIFNVPFNEKIQSNINIIKKSENVADRLFSDIENHKQYFFQDIIHNMIFFIGIKPFVIKKGEKYSGIKNRWNKIGILNENS